MFAAEQPPQRRSNSSKIFFVRRNNLRSKVLFEESTPSGGSHGCGLPCPPVLLCRLCAPSCLLPPWPCSVLLRVCVVLHLLDVRRGVVRSPGVVRRFVCPPRPPAVALGVLWCCGPPAVSLLAPCLRVCPVVLCCAGLRAFRGPAQRRVVSCRCCFLLLVGFRSLRCFPCGCPLPRRVAPCIWCLRRVFVLRPIVAFGVVRLMCFVVFFCAVLCCAGLLLWYLAVWCVAVLCCPCLHCFCSCRAVCCLVRCCVLCGAVLCCCKL